MLSRVSVLAAAVTSWAGSSSDWKLPLRIPHVGKERVAREQGFIRENKQT